MVWDFVGDCWDILSTNISMFGVSWISLQLYIHVISWCVMIIKNIIFLYLILPICNLVSEHRFAIISQHQSSWIYSTEKGGVCPKRKNVVVRGESLSVYHRHIWAVNNWRKRKVMEVAFWWGEICVRNIFHLFAASYYKEVIWIHP